ncbi:MAG: LpqN/LpqT family lipoprotein [Mycobacterium sp.]
MNTFTRLRRVAIGSIGLAAAGSVVLIGVAGNSASAEPGAPAVPAPPATVTVTVTPQAATATTPAPAPAPTAVATGTPGSPLAPATSGTLLEFLKDKGVTLEPQRADGFSALNIVLPIPTGWGMVPDPNVPDAFAVIADRQGGDALYTPNAQLVVYKLVGEFDSREAISHGYVESQKLQAWQSTAASMVDFGGFPSSVIGGTYRENDQTLNTTRRNVIAQAGSDRYLLALSVTTSANQVVATANSTDAILNGFRVTAPAAASPAASATSSPATSPATSPAASAAASPAATAAQPAA